MFITHTFDIAVDYMVEFDTENEAIDFMEWKWKAYYDDAVQEEYGMIEEECKCDKDYGFAVIAWDDGGYTYFHVESPTPPPEEWTKYRENNNLKG